MGSTDFRVVPEALKLEAEEIRQASENWNSARGQVSDNPLDNNALGVYGAQIAAKFNSATAPLARKLEKGVTTIQSAADGLKTAATHFENVDAEYYRRFGYIDAQIGY
ncbi:hypothetical protein IU474_01555 [Nocardia otitidiscaviarum]|uniref:type VII secretion target n=1 Tax=Nocardia otitidiscaviarum TaxID=1823 RepID=UPI001894A3B8|nr:type VII secretion target [Nocardia otitidiscaviarum]MBF6235767.1 hypothetical protein [Nocardia otitidiscaviarum]